ncbi:MAG: membrane dipeptidase [Clostridia bacterium]|nr:membrane dipeptidase [Clostridia bacterium]
MMFVADAHCDTLSGIARWNRKMDDCTVTLERMQQGGVGLQTFAMFAGGKGPAGTPYQDAKKMLAASYELPLEIIRGKLPDAPPQNPTGILSIEGGEVIVGSLEKLAEFDDDTRIRMISLTWNNENEIAYPGKGGSDQPLKPFGVELLKEMDRRGILADVSHLNDAGFWDVCERSALPPVATHSNCRWICGHSRNLTKDMVKAVIDKKGFIGINFYSAFLADDGNATLDHVLRHIDELFELGGENVVGFGSDFDGIDAWPEGLANPADFPNLLNLLAQHGYTQTQLEKIAGLNLWRVLKQADAARAI